MWLSKPPDFTASEVAEACVAGIHDRDLAERLGSIMEKLDQNSLEYQRAFSTSLVGFDIHDVYTTPTVHPDEMRSLYDRRLRAKNSNARRYYELLRQSGPHQRCSYCVTNEANTLDHVVPKAHCGSLAIEPWNLVPSCSNCNSNLASGWKERARKGLIHPYFFDYEKRWLYARPSDYDRTVYEFYCHFEPDTQPDIISAVTRTVESLSLLTRYAEYSVVEIAFSHGMLERLHEPLQRQAWLSDTSQVEFEIRANSWRGAFYEAFAENEVL